MRLVGPNRHCKWHYLAITVRACWQGLVHPLYHHRPFVECGIGVLRDDGHDGGFRSAFHKIHVAASLS